MKTFLILFVITFAVFGCAALVINFSKRRVSRTSHGLTGMCHKDGGPMCSCCGEKLAAPVQPAATSKDRCC
jgi:hypothetical protein